MREWLEQEWLLNRLEEGLRLAEKGSDKALYTLINALPCILHMENRVGLKILTRVLTVGVSNACKGDIMAEAGDSEIARFQALIETINHVVNYDI